MTRPSSESRAGAKPARVRGTELASSFGHAGWLAMTPRVLTPLVLLFVSSCFVNVFGHSPIQSSTGTASIRWTIDGRVEDWSCLSLSATGARVVVHDREGEVVIAREQ